MRQLSCNLFATLMLIVSFIFVMPQNAQADFADISRIYRTEPHLDSFDICFRGGCAELAHVALSEDEWLSVVNVFNVTNAEDTHAENNALLTEPELERKKISKAIAVFEEIVGAKTGTSEDRAGTFKNSQFTGQLDCNDEAINTTTYVRLMVQNGLIRFHAIEDIRTRKFFFTGWPHTTAVINEIATGERYAVDSWFYDNGAPAIIVPFAIWKSGYVPADSPIGRLRHAATN